MQILLNTIMLEPKLWHSPKCITVPLIKLLPDIKRKHYEARVYHDELQKISCLKGGYDAISQN